MFNLWIVYAYLAAMLGLFVFYGIASGYVFFTGGEGAWNLLKIGLSALACIYGAFLFPTFLGLTVNYKELRLNPLLYLETLIAHPIFYMGYIPIEVKAIFSRKTKMAWEEIARVEVAE